MNRVLPSRHSIRKHLRLYMKLQLVQIRAAIEYRADFWIGIVGAMLQQGAGLVFVSALFSQIPEVAGWTVWNIAILYGLAMLPKGLTELFCDGPWTLRGKVNSGEFDRVLVRPVSPALHRPRRSCPSTASGKSSSVSSCFGWASHVPNCRCRGGRSPTSR